MAQSTYFFIDVSGSMMDNQIERAAEVVASRRSTIDRAFIFDYNKMQEIELSDFFINTIKYINNFNLRRGAAEYSEFDLDMTGILNTLNIFKVLITDGFVSDEFKQAFNEIVLV